ncbi:CRISPR-associated helicase Cas3' [Cohnella fermenti]|uniref:CRISPR-associated helicase Cas3 n=1 Tax=Cohnella fermenti TaxID=2565925 RepID=A0A4S4C6I4_9BACL|nr:CRISPR-associated helicase Cas3' [Cohnella fermenti]THF83511.1 CRISPR-associated helicase Cas3' [Cohnella fermenti]
MFAHVVRSAEGSWASPHDLLKHLVDTGDLAERFASKFDSGEWGNAIGLAHDAGKGRALWQKYLITKSGYDEEAHMEGKLGKIPHAIHGAELVENLFGKGIGRMMAYCIAGHHAGLPDWSIAAGQASLQFRKSQVKDLDQIDSKVIDCVRGTKPLRPPWKFKDGLDLSLWIRMLFSCLVDADFLDTERYMNPSKALVRGGYSSISKLLERFYLYMTELDEQSEKTKVNEIRNQIRQQCMLMSKEKQGIFSLTVPTGGGKTLSSLAFALQHAKLHELERIIYVIPYTSIVEQTANVFRKAVGDDQVVEHHSNIADDIATVQSRLAAENYDAPLIVTTSVQFFESLFASKPSRCRKLHNLAKSVIVLDEAQLVPVEYLAPILEAIQLLVDRYQVSFVISTATQPAFKERTVDGKLFKGLQEIKEIMGTEEDVRRLFQSPAFDRNRVQLPVDVHKESTWDEIAVELKQDEQVLCIVSDRKSCRELHALMPEGTYHLSALMCGQHRSDVIDEVKRKLKPKDRSTVRVISTQLVEAGVDLDFPVVYRALAGLDSIEQAAGRCNREGEHLERGRVVVFNPPRQAPSGILRKAAEITKSMIGGLSDGSYEAQRHSSFTAFYEQLYWRANSLDREGIAALLNPSCNDSPECSISFRTAAGKFKLIDDSKQRSILIRYKEGNQLIDKLVAKGPNRSLLRKLQRYTVSVYEDQFHALLQRGAIQEVYPQIYAVSSTRGYSKQIGLLLE